MTSNEIRQQFLDFFKSKDHRIVPSAPVVPYDDLTLLFTNAGMNQFKDVFLGTGTREYKRAADTQKCIRVSGKHNDLEEVGHDTYHHTFFEMLGNWSFGDPSAQDGIGTGYYKKEAIGWAWELLTEVWKLPKERLWATVYRTDDEAFNYWKSETDINPKHILRFDEKDNFWEMGETGPCGPCSEIHINLSDDYDNPKFVNAGVPECIEIWNLVFIQYNSILPNKGLEELHLWDVTPISERNKLPYKHREEIIQKYRVLNPLQAKHVDTGMGFERVCAVLQKKGSNYDTDVFTPIINAVEKLSGVKYEKTEDIIPMRVIADHIRTLTFAIADGATPGNEGRGYVLRRILRRAARYGRKINLTEPFLFKLVHTVVNNFGSVFPEIITNVSNVKKIIKAEEESFNATLDRGIDEYSQIGSGSVVSSINKNNLTARRYYDFAHHDWEISVENGQGLFDTIFFNKIDKDFLERYSSGPIILSGEDVFKLYDTFGFPIDLTAVMAREQGFTIDEARFNELMNEQKERARKSTKDKLASVNVVLDKLDDFNLTSTSPTEFTGYEELKSEAKVIGLKNDGDKSLIVLDRTPFYVESGGQISDKGNLLIGDTHLRVIDVAKVNNQTVHVVENESGIEIKNGMKVTAEVDEYRRWDIMRNHSATHFLHRSLREILGTHVQQAGSYVGPDRLRFDFSHFEKVKDAELKAIESLVNEKLRENLPLHHHRNTPFEKAKKMGALMFFGDKYGDKVNVVQFGDFTMEFCGGTHVQNSSQIGLLKIVNESSIASGVRRIEAVTGAGVERYIKEQEDRIQKSEVKIDELTEEKRKLEKELADLKLKEKLGGIDSIVSSPTDAAGIKVYKGKVDASNMDELKSMGDELRAKIKSGVGVLISEIDGKVGIVAVVSDDLMKEKKMSAGKIVGDLAKIVDGGGGGRSHLATAGGKDVSKIDEALNSIEKFL